ncbi:hypothetical protein IQ264_27080 [Phormidium sp. LEGE 05292]|uniref:hypothetical protein n=1 Tax=[Phormidium] sp. LEGE 05292 TaxID=767427 RepID=UPI0018830B74|nr:hypothetical protein [Phormidium sp. LEGE 05292]MBE9229076.1 hypothetical protein [Phormidium sp. LEGE 05292]
MKSLLKLLRLPIAVSICLSGIPCRLVLADSTADLILNLHCQGGYNVQVWKNGSTGGLMYRSQSSSGNMKIERGTKQATEVVTVYKFRNGTYQYWVWDGTLDSPNRGTLEAYRNDRILMKRQCQKI